MSQGNQETQRLFFALWPDASVRAQLAQLARQWSRQPIPEERLHMTLVFLGECDAERRDCYRSAAATIAAEPFTLALDFLGGRARSRIQWLGASETPEALLELVVGLSRALQPCGYEAEKRRFLPHVTLSRKVKKPMVKAGLGALIWPVEDFALVESVREPEGGVRYEVLERWALRKPA